MNAETNTYFVTPQRLAGFCVEAMLRQGMRKKDARMTAHVLVKTDMWGTFTHGSKQVRGLLKNFRDGRMDENACDEVVSESLLCGVESEANILSFSPPISTET